MSHRSSTVTVLLAWMFFVAIALCPSRGMAQVDPPRMRAVAQPSEVAVGDVFSIRLTAMASQSAQPPDRPALRVPAGLAVRGSPQIATRVEQRIGAQSVLLVGVEVTWQVEALKPGKYRVKPPSIQFMGRRIEANPVDVTVHPRGAGAPQTQRDPDPFDPFGMLGGPKFRSPQLPGLFDDLLNPQQPSEPPADPKLSLPAAPDGTIFLYAFLDKTNAVVGEQVTLLIYQYTRTGAARPVEVHEPSLPDFLQRSLVAPGDETEVRVAEVAGNPWHAELLLKAALFPLHAGRLELGPMRASFNVRLAHKGRTNTVVTRQSNSLALNVTEAPAKGRPLGFRQGDVGEFSLAAKVEPRTVEVGGAVGVSVQVKGIGNLPTSITVPARTGVQWLDPEIREQAEVQGDKIGGTRTFSYVVKLLEAGATDLGEIVLPYFDPVRRTYSTTRATLGQIQVTPGVAPVASAVPERNPFAGVGPVRPSLINISKNKTPWTDHPLYWILLAGCPLAVLASGGMVSLTRWTAERVHKARSSTDRRVALDLQHARQAVKDSRRQEAALAIERVIHGCIEGASGVKSRGLLREELGPKLCELGVDKAIALRAVEVLVMCEEARFHPDFDNAKLHKMIEVSQTIASSIGRRRVGSTTRNKETRA